MPCTPEIAGTPDMRRADAESAGDRALADLFTKAQADSKKGAEYAKDMLRERLSG